MVPLQGVCASGHATVPDAFRPALMVGEASAGEGNIFSVGSYM